MNKIKEDIKNHTFEKVYLLYGEEDFLREDYKKRLFRAVTGDDTMNTLVISGREFTKEEAEEFTNTLPFFAEKRVLLLEDTELFQHSSEGFSSWLETLPETAVVIFSETKIDKRNALYKKVNSIGYVSEFAFLNEDNRKKFILKELKEHDLKIQNEAFDLLLEYLPENLFDIQNELKKLIDYCLEKDFVTAEDVRTVVSPRLENRIFEMISDIASGDRKPALTKYYELLSLKEAPMKILSLLSREFYRLLVIKKSKSAGMSDSETVKALGIYPSILWKFKKEAAKFSEEMLFSIVNELLLTEYKIKTGDLADQTAIELLLFSLTEHK